MVADSPLSQRRLDLPPDIFALCMFGSGAWLIGSAADPERTPPFKDYDMVVPWSDWSAFALQIPFVATFNRFTRFGGLSLTMRASGVALDVWPDDIGRLATMPFPFHAWHVKSHSLLTRS